jgi:hypothetical protein
VKLPLAPQKSNIDEGKNNDCEKEETSNKGNERKIDMIKEK